MNPFALHRDEEPGPSQYSSTVTAVESSVRRPPCECADCQNGFFAVEEQYSPEHSCHRRLSDAEAERSARSVVRDIHRRRTQLSEQIDVFGDVLLSRWKKRSQAKRAVLLKEAAPDVEEQQWFLP